MCDKATDCFLDFENDFALKSIIYVILQTITIYCQLDFIRIVSSIFD